MAKPLSDGKMCAIIRDAWKDFSLHKGNDCTVFMSAIGALAFGREVGWQGVRVCMSASTFRKYEKILGVKFREVLLDQTKDSERIEGILMVKRFGKFWQREAEA